MTRPARSAWRWIRPIRRWCTPRCGRCPASTGHFRAAGQAAASTRRPTAGANWSNISHRPGLPTGIFGKVGIAVAPSRPDVVYALIQADYKGQTGGLFRSDDAGQSWKLINNSMDITQRAFYYMSVYVDPKDPNTIYLPNVGVYVSHNGGKKLIALHPPHGDNHVFWINPNNPQIFIEGNDGGASRHAEWRQDLELGGQSADRAVLSRQSRRSVPVPYLRRAAGSGLGRGAERRACRESFRRFGQDIQGGEMSWVVPTPGQPWITYGSGYYSIEWRENRGRG